MQEPQPKPIILSKTVLVQIVALVILTFPQAREFLAPYATEVGGAWAVLNIVLRMITKDRVKIV